MTMGKEDVLYVEVEIWTVCMRKVKRSRKQITGGLHLEVIGKVEWGLSFCKIITGKDHL